MLVLRLVGVVGPVLLLLSQVMQDPVKTFTNKNISVLVLKSSTRITLNTVCNKINVKMKEARENSTNLNITSQQYKRSKKSRVQRF